MPLQSLKFPTLLSHEFLLDQVSEEYRFTLFSYPLLRAETATSIQSVYARSQIRNSRLESLVKFFVVANHGEERFSFASPNYQGRFYRVASRVSFSNGSNIAGAIVNPGESLVIDFNDCWSALMEIYNPIINGGGITGEASYETTDFLTDFPAQRFNGWDVNALFQAVVNINGEVGSELQHATYLNYLGSQDAASGGTSTQTVDQARTYLYAPFRKSAGVLEYTDLPTKPHPGDEISRLGTPFQMPNQECCRTCYAANGSAGDTLEVFQDAEFTLDISGISGTTFTTRYDLTAGVRIVRQSRPATASTIVSDSLDPNTGIASQQTETLETGANRPYKYQQIVGAFPATVNLCHTYSTSGYQFYMRTHDGYLTRMCINYDDSTNTIEIQPPVFSVEDQIGEELYGLHQYLSNPPVNALTTVTDIDTLTFTSGRYVLPMDTEVIVDLAAIAKGELTNITGYPIPFSFTIPANPGKFEWTLSATAVTEDGSALYPELDNNDQWEITSSIVGANGWGRAFEETPYYFVSNDGMEAGEEGQVDLTFDNVGIITGGVLGGAGDPTLNPSGVYFAKIRLYESDNCGLPTYSSNLTYASLVGEVNTGNGTSGSPYVVSINSAVDAITSPATSAPIVHFQVNNLSTDDLEVRVFSSPSTSTLPGIHAALPSIRVYDDPAFSNELSVDSTNRPHDGLILDSFGIATAEWLQRGEEAPDNISQSLPNTVYVQVEFPDTASTYAANRQWYVEFFERYDKQYGDINLPFNGNGTLADPYIMPLSTVLADVAYGDGDVDNAIYIRTLLDYTVETTLDLTTVAATSFGASQTTISLYSDPGFSTLVASNVGAPYASLSDATLLAGAFAYIKIENNTGNFRGGFGLTIAAS